MNKSAIVVACVALLWVSPAIGQDFPLPHFIGPSNGPLLVSSYSHTQGPVYVNTWPGWSGIHPAVVPLTDSSTLALVGLTPVLLPDSGSVVWTLYSPPRYGAPRIDLSTPPASLAERETLRR